MATLTDTQRAAGWKKYVLSDIVEIIGGGTPKTSNPEYWNGDIPWLSVTDFSGDSRYVYDTEKKITQDGLENSSTKLLLKDDIIISARGTVGELAQLSSPMAFNQSCFGIRAIPDKLNQSYLYYLLRTVIEELRQNSHGSIFSTITRKTFDTVEVIIPPHEEQENIAGILGSLDDKIEANIRLIGLLDETVKVFVKKDKSIVTYKISDKLIHSTKQELPSAVTSEMIYHYSLPAYDSGQNPKLEDPRSIKSNKFLITEPCLLLSKLNPKTPRIWCAYPKKGYRNYASTEFVVLVPKKHEELAALWASCSEGSLYKNLQGMAGGTSASHQRVKPIDILAQDIDVSKNTNIYTSYISQIDSLSSENVYLVNIRNLLIKKLIG